MKYDKDRTRRRVERILRSADIRWIMHDLNIKTDERAYGDIWYPCVCPAHREKTPSAHIRCDSTIYRGKWHCFGCKNSGTILDIIKFQLQLDFWESLLWAESRLGEYEDVTPDTTRQVEITLPKEFENPSKPEDWDQKFLSYLYGRGIEWYQIKKHRIGYCKNGRAKNRVVIPVSLFGRLRSWIGRTVVNDRMRVMTPWQGKSALLGYEFAKPKLGPAIVVEGWADKLMVDRLGYPNVMSVQTSAIDHDQFEFLEKFKQVIIMPDGDGGGDNFINSICPYMDYAEFFTARVPRGKDPGDCTNEEIVTALDNVERWEPVVSERDIEIRY